ncbi:50S ribosomal protein L10 [Candidatus Nardonella dryophthoridicola]|uniref:50S ribosomal protein L10 n=1 Tax=Candidatus Nardonella dryophthoridicola TaxID=1971485 RepID=UPI001AD878F2|nr:50S ribosomal protein L10 [Candidatus Nardonella dryophthoridicola]QTJ62839.1 50S ribosomal protein L10 [Candidatus Nardonella dryophthoridicola]
MKKNLNKKKIVLKNNVIINNSISISFFKLDNIKSNQINYLRKISKKKSIKIIICKNKLLDIIFKRNNIPLLNIKNNNIILCHEENPSISLNIFKEFSKYNNINYKDYLNFIYFDKKIYKTDEEIEYISNISDIKSLLIKFCIILKNISIIKLYNTLKLLKKNKKNDNK